MSRHADGGPAFPTPWAAGTATEGGMTLRDWFAGQALASMVRDYETTGAMLDAETAAEVAGDAYVVADAMLKERKK